MLQGKGDLYEDSRPRLLASEFDRKLLVANYRCHIELQRTIEHLKREHNGELQKLSYQQREFQRKRERLTKRKTDIARERSITPSPYIQTTETIQRIPQATEMPPRPKSAPIREEREQFLSRVTPAGISVRSLSAAERRLGVSNKNKFTKASRSAYAPRRSLPVVPVSRGWE